MLDAQIKVCIDCGSLSMEGGPAPDNLDDCSNCNGRLEDVEPSDVIGF